MSVGCSITLPDEDSVDEFARQFAAHLQAPLVIYLRGDLGAGKTTFVRALIHALGHSGRVKSPSYGLLEPYTAAGFNILHLDLYRIESAAELEHLSIRDLFDSKSILLVEWPEKGAGFLAPADLELGFEETGELHILKVKPRSEAGEAMARALGFRAPGNGAAQPGNHKGGEAESF